MRRTHTPGDQEHQERELAYLPWVGRCCSPECGTEKKHPKKHAQLLVLRILRPQAIQSAVQKTNTIVIIVTLKGKVQSPRAGLTRDST